VTMRSWVQVLETATCRNAGKDCVHKTQSGRTLPWTLRKLELHAPGCPFICSNVGQVYGPSKSWKQSLAEMQGKTAYIRPKVVGPFPEPYASWSCVPQAALLSSLMWGKFMDPPYISLFANSIHGNLVKALKLMFLLLA
jgi:hypothetical protein